MQLKHFKYALAFHSPVDMLKTNCNFGAYTIGTVAHPPFSPLTVYATEVGTVGVTIAQITHQIGDIILLPQRPSCSFHIQ